MAVEEELLPGVGDGARLVDHEAGDGHGVVVRQIPIHGAVEIADGDITVDVHRAVGLAADTPCTA